MSKEFFVPEAYVFESVDELWAKHPGEAAIPLISFADYEEVKILKIKLNDLQPFDAYYSNWKVERDQVLEEIKELKAELFDWKCEAEGYKAEVERLKSKLINAIKCEGYCTDTGVLGGDIHIEKGLLLPEEDE